MSEALDRASLYLQQGRYDQALRELTMAAADEPNSYRVAGMMALAFAELDQKKEALKAAEESVALAPDRAWPHYIHAITLMKNQKAKLAEKAIRTAIQIEPDNPDYHHGLGRILSAGARWKAALASANLALELDPGHEDALTLRAQALSYTGKGDDARSAARQAVAENPGSADAHAELGWVSLRHGDRKEAERHFQESLRLDPGDELARDGLLESLRAGFAPYAALLKVNFLIGRLPREAQSVLLIGAYIVFKVSARTARSTPTLAPILIPVAIIFGTFYFLRWFGDLIADAILLFHPLGRVALGPQRRMEALIFSGFLALIPISSVISVLTRLNLWDVSITSGLSLFILGFVHKIESSPTKHRRAFLLGTVLASMITLTALVTDIVRFSKRG